MLVCTYSEQPTNFPHFTQWASLSSSPVSSDNTMMGRVGTEDSMECGGGELSCELTNSVYYQIRQCCCLHHAHTTLRRANIADRENQMLYCLRSGLAIIKTFCFISKIYKWEQKLQQNKSRNVLSFVENIIKTL